MPRDTQLKKRSVRISGHPTSVTLEQPFWDALKNIAKEQGQSINTLLSDIDENRENNNLSSATRIYILRHLQRQCGNA